MFQFWEVDDNLFMYVGKWNLWQKINEEKQNDNSMKTKTEDSECGWMITETPNW